MSKPPLRRLGDSHQASSRSFTFLLLNKKPFGEHVEGHFHCGDKSCAIERAQFKLTIPRIRRFAT